MNKFEAIERLEQSKEKAKELIELNRKNQEFKKWLRNTEVAIERIFGRNTRHLEDFNAVSYYPTMLTNLTTEVHLQERYQSGIKNAITLIESLVDEINDYWTDEPKIASKDFTTMEKVELLIRKFHKVARQIKSRHSSRYTIEIEDEYDAQDLFHALLRIFFDDVRSEEYTPSYAGAASRVDFLLKEEQIVIEIKKTRKGLSAKEVGEQLIVDTQRYQSHPDCRKLVCFVYDPEGRIANPKGIENDLSKELNGVPVVVLITPE